SSLPRLSEVYDAYGVEVNALSVSEIFELYERTGFLYPDKAARLLPHLEQVRENWRRMLRGGDSLLYVLTAGDKKSGRASIAVWRTTHYGWTSQHLVSENNPVASRAVMLAGTAASILRGVDESHQNWFRPENRFPSRVFGSLPSGGRVRIVPYDPSHEEALSLIASVARGSIYVAAEQLTTDPELTEVDQLYREVGLRRTRRVWLAYREYKDEPIGAAIVYRGPLGLNFSYIENRCDLLLHPTLPEADAVDVVASLLRASSSAYEDFELDAIPVIAEEIAAPALLQLGAEFLRHYCQGAWLQEGQLRCYRHVEGFYSRILARVEKHAMQPTLIA
ncbi:MAG: hypothetical protein DMG49_01610, partial [Acidobacteria bacterium]